MKSIQISKPDQSLRGVIRLPSSKSISNRLLLIRALSGIDCDIDNLSDAEDTQLLMRLLDTIQRSDPKAGVVELDVENAGTVMRFLTAYLSMKPGKWVLTGSERMKQRPVGILVEALNQLGGSIQFLAKPGFPPLLMTGHPLQGNNLSIDPGISSQFTSALLMMAPLLPEGLVLHLKGKPVSMPSVMMTTRLMQQAGIMVRTGKTRIHVQPGEYQPVNLTVESDWSAAAFWYEAAVFAADVDLELTGLFPDSLQGDAILPSIFQNFGIRTEFTPNGIRLTRFRKKIDGFYFDFTNYPDIAQAIIVTCAALGIRGRFEGVQSLRIKETDRLMALKNEVEKIGVVFTLFRDQDQITAVEINPGKIERPALLKVDSYGDHRTAMAMAPLAFKVGTLHVQNPDVVVKSYPGFWDDMQSLGFRIF